MEQLHSWGKPVRGEEQFEIFVAGRGYQGAFWMQRFNYNTASAGLADAGFK